MDFGSIVGFLMIAGISYLFNNAKNSSTENSKPNRTQTTTREENNTRKNTTTKMRTSLEDVFKDLSKEFNTNLGENSKKQPENTSKKVVNTEIKTDSYRNKKPIKSSENKKNSDSKKGLRFNTKENTDSVYSGAIGEDEKLIEFNKKSIVQGVIMSEILQKPKSLRR